VSATRPPAYDERYAAPVEASRRGAHRARPNPLTSVIPVIAGMAVVVLVVVGAFTLLGDRGGSEDPGTAAGAQPTTAPSASASASAAPSASASAPAASGSATADPSAPAGEVDKTIELRVLNSISVGGLAARYSEQLQENDWVVGETGDANQRDLATTRVYYGKTSQKPTADALVVALGFGEVKKSAVNAGEGITIVLGEDADT
jgi:hypothetical protein